MIRVWNYIWNRARSDFFLCHRWYVVAVSRSHSQELGGRSVAHTQTRTLFTDIYIRINVYVRFVKYARGKIKAWNENLRDIFSSSRFRFVLFRSVLIRYVTIFFSIFLLFVNRTHIHKLFLTKRARANPCASSSNCYLDLWIERFVSAVCTSQTTQRGSQSCRHSLGSQTHSHIHRSKYDVWCLFCRFIWKIFTLLSRSLVLYFPDTEAELVRRCVVA